jgi:hypothetical protein
MGLNMRLVSSLAAGMLASCLSGFLINCQWGHAPEPSAYPVSASLEMMQLLRAEHDLVAGTVKAQVEAERTELPRQRAVGSADPYRTSASIVPPQGDRRSLTARGRRTS